MRIFTRANRRDFVSNFLTQNYTVINSVLSPCNRVGPARAYVRFVRSACFANRPVIIRIRRVLKYRDNTYVRDVYTCVQLLSLLYADVPTEVRRSLAVWFVV